MRVLLCSHVAPPHIGGVESIVRMEAFAFAAAGHDVVWITSDAGGEGEAIPAHERVTVVRVRAWHLLERRFGIAYPLFGPGLVLRLLRETARADLVHVHGLVFPASPLAAVCARVLGVPVVCTDHGGLLRYPSRFATSALRLLFATAGRVTARAAHKLVALNHDVERLLARLGGDAGKVEFLPNPVDDVVFRPPTAAERAAARASLGWDGRPRVLCVCRLLPHKGIDVLLAARDAAFEVVFCGPGEEAVRAALRAGGAECVPPRPQAELLALYHAADAFALPSHNEGFPIVIQEALACGLPVVTSDLPAYAPYRGTPGLQLCEPTPAAVRERLHAVLGEPRQLAAGDAAERPLGAARAAWLQRLCNRLPAAAPRGKLWLAAVLLLGLHFAFTALRWPAGSVGKRAASIAEFCALGTVGWHYRLTDNETRSIAEWLVENVPADEVVRFRGNHRAVQLLAPTLFPRLLVDADRVPPGNGIYKVFAGRPPWHGAEPPGPPVLVAPDRKTLRLEYR